MRRFAESDTESVVALWTQVFNYDELHSDPYISIERKTSRDPDLFMVAVADGRIIGTVMGGYDGHRGWVYSLAVDEARRHSGIGSALVERIEQSLKAIGCLKVNLQVVGSNSSVVDFYKRLGFSVEDRISMGKRLY
ncbi:MAG: GNAT family acetyltransferase [Dehalococcoidia bacterium]|nr:GNAT family acetyltransferase [Dehalococcoidia bacterium]